MPDNCLLENNVFDKFSELADKLTAHPFFLVIFNITLVVLWVIIGTDFANIFISIVTAESVLIGASSVRRGQLAIQAKLDEIIHALDPAREELVGVEHKKEKEIQSLKLGD